jgi:stress response protein YsnF
VPVRTEGDVTIIPVLEETVVVEKRLLLREEVHVRLKTHEEHQPQRVRLRSEDVVVERTRAENAQTHRE